MNKFLQALIKINHISGFLPCNLSQVMAVVATELNALLAGAEIKFLLASLESEKEELSWLVTGGLVAVRQDCKVIREGLPLLAEGDFDCPDCDTLNKDNRMCLPISTGKEVLGCLAVGLPEIQPLKREELEVLVAVANQVAVTIQRNRLLQHCQQENEMLTIANQEIRSLNEELTELVSHLQATQAQLIHSEKLAAVGRLAANLSHEINNPTGIILSRLECMLWEQELPPQLLADLQVIKRQAQRIGEITRSLLTFSRKAPPVKEIVNLTELTLETAGWLEHQLKRQSILLSLNLTQDCFVNGNREQLQQVLVNLLLNAKDALPTGGSVTVNLVKNDMNRIVLEVADSGHGIPTGDINRIFEPFYTSKEPGKGTGLGLFVTYNIIREHEGEIKAESEVNKGSKFTISLPISHQPYRYD